MLGTGGAAAGGKEVKHIAWLAEQVRTAGAVPKALLWGQALPGAVPGDGGTDGAVVAAVWLLESPAASLGTGLCHFRIPQLACRLRPGKGSASRALSPLSRWDFPAGDAHHPLAFP